MKGPCSLSVAATSSLQSAYTESTDSMLRRNRMTPARRFSFSAPRVSSSRVGPAMPVTSSCPHSSRSSWARLMKGNCTLSSHGQVATRCADELGGELLQDPHVGALEHDAELRLRAAPAHQDAALLPELLLRRAHAAPELAHLLDGAARGEEGALQHLRHALHHRGELGERLLLAHHDAEDLQRGDDAVARRGVVAEDEMPRLLAAERVPLRAHRFDHVAIADGGADQVAPGASHGLIEAHVAHDGGDEGSMREPPVLQHACRAEGHDGVAVDDLPALVHDDDAIRVAVERDAHVRIPTAELL